MANGDNTDTNEGICDYVARKSEPESWHGDTEDEWFLDKKPDSGGLGIEEWRCPHPALETDKRNDQHCVFHTEDVLDDVHIDWDEEIMAELDNRGESPYSDGPEHRGQFVGVTVGSVDLSSVTIASDSHDIRFDHAVFEGRGNSLRFDGVEFIT